MEYPYIVVLWSPRSEQQTLEASRLLMRLQGSGTHWQQSTARDGIVVLTRGTGLSSLQPRFLGALPLSDQCGLILGILFRKSSGVRLSPDAIAEDRELAQNCLRTRGACLLQDFWGGYVAFLSDHRSGDWSVLRDCSGMIPCYYTAIRGVTLAFSDIRDLPSPNDPLRTDDPLPTFEINWRYIVGFLASSQMQIRETGLKNVYELLAGESLESTAGRCSVRPLWDPVSLAECDPFVDVEDICPDLRQTTQSCIAAWAGVQGRILHSLSGGFDSSLVLSLLMRASQRPEVLCVNRFATGPAEDERKYARLAAQAAGAELTELPWEGGQALDRFCWNTPRTAKPTIPQIFAGLDAAINDRIAKSYGAETMWTGQGGDHLFMALATGMGAADCRIHHGKGPTLNAALRDAAKLTGKSYYCLAREANALRKPKRFLSLAQLNPRTTLLPTDALPADLDSYIRHPWTESSTSLPPGKRLQVLYLAEILNRHRPYYGSQMLQEFHPLLSQPLIELCLRIPVYHLLTGGKTRGLARMAFHADLPAAILTREQKGQTTHLALDMLRKNSSFLSEVLLNGQLAQNGILDREVLRSLLRPDTSITIEALFPILACLAAEIWIQTSRISQSVSHATESLRRPSPNHATTPF